MKLAVVFLTLTILAACASQPREPELDAATQWYKNNIVKKGQ